MLSIGAIIIDASRTNQCLVCMVIFRGRHSVTSLHAHLVFVTKRRGKAFDSKHLTYLESIFRSVLEDFASGLIEFSGEADHVHLLIAYPPKRSISAIVNSLKGVSSRKLKQAFPEISHFWSVANSKNALWSPSYYASSVGGAPIATLRTYIEKRKRPD
jgi:putative transposase